MKIYCQNVWNYNPCDYRNTLISNLIYEFDADVCLFQECGPETNRTGKKPLPKLIDEKYAEVETPVKNDNFTPVFYKKEKYTLIDSDYFLYDGLNDANSKSVTWAVLEDKETLKKIAVASTHFWWMARSEEDNQQRLQNAAQLKECCDNIILKHGVDVIVGGDFNNGKNSNQGDMPYKEMLKMGFEDIRYTAKQTTDTFTHHKYPVLNDEGIYVDGAMPTMIIDYIFTYGKHAPKPLKFEVLTTEVALNSSDHCPILGIFDF